MFDFLKVIFFAGVMAFSYWLDHQSPSDYIFYTIIAWILILLYCYIRFGKLNDKS